MNLRRENLFRADELTRRRFVARAAQALLGVGLLPGIFPRLAGAPVLAGVPAGGGTAKNVIYLYMDGGMSHVDTWDPKEGETAGPTKMIKTRADGIQLGEYLPRTAQEMHHGALIRSLSSNQGAHEQGNYFMHTSYEMRGTISHPSMGAWLSHFRGAGNPSLPASVYIGNSSRPAGAGFFPATHSPLFVNNPEAGLKDIALQKGLTPEAHLARMQLAEELDAGFVAGFPQEKISAHSEIYDGAYKMMKSEDLEAFDLTKEKPEVREAYGKGAFGQGCLLARRLVEKGVHFVEVSLNGWDTHSNNFVATPALCEQLDKALSALIGDLGQRGMLKDTLVVVATEFGRTPVINSNLGRDHYPKAFSGAMFGGGVKGGTVIGSTDKTGGEVEGDPVLLPDFNATIAYALGLPIQEAVISPSLRPFTIANKGVPVTEIFA
jgi:hypothetical protein